MKGNNCSLWNTYAPSPSNSLLYSAISISSRVLMSSNIWYSWPWRSVSARICISCCSSAVTWLCRLCNCMEYRPSVSAKVPSSDPFCRWKLKRGGRERRKSELVSYLCLEPGFKVSRILGGHSLILLTNFCHNEGQVLWLPYVHLHVDLSSHLVSHE
ncbi:hypothetical protein F7725_012233 [Dissostichus mawsoni]|uniref:Uncharacterized protein n=1 Tax=Dissostichus mawsoni TaxID=36200 RepID=A0A7J5YNE1_DISMA|nr:hypothetical protein F7725_012233 [Dissostichus mawsoni]